MIYRTPTWILLIVLFTALAAPASAFASTLGQVDTFENGTTENWIAALLGAPHPAPPQNIPDGGPGGAGDNFLKLTALGGNGAGSRLTAINYAAQWAGDYLAERIRFLGMDLNNLGVSDLQLRLRFADPLVGPPDNAAFSTDAVFLPSGSGWVTAYFPIDPSDLTALVGNVTDAITQTTELRLFHSPDPSYPGPAVVGFLGVDNIRALTTLPVPEPATWMLLLAGVGSLVLIRRRG